MSFSLSPAPVCHSSGSSTPRTSPHRSNRYSNRTPSTSAIVPFPRSLTTEARRKSRSPRISRFYTSPSRHLNAYDPTNHNPSLIMPASASPAKPTRSRASKHVGSTRNTFAFNKLRSDGDSTVWTHSRASSSKHRLDSSGSDDFDDEPAFDGLDQNNLSPATSHSRASSSSKPHYSSGNLDPHDRIAGLMDESDSMSSHQATQGLESHFATYVSMTPPASFGSKTSKETPFSWNNHLPVPVTELRHKVGGIPRSHAFGSLAPLSSFTRESPNQSILEVQQSPSLNAAGSTLRSTGGFPSGLGILGDDRLANWQEAQCLAAVDLAQPTYVDAQALPLASHTQAQTNSHNLMLTSVGTRRGRIPTFLAPPSTDATSGDMDLDSDTDADAPPLPSPTPMGDLPLASELSPSSSSTGSNQPMLQPGLRSVPRKANRRASCSSGHGELHPARKTSFEAKGEPSPKPPSHASGTSFTANRSRASSIHLKSSRARAYSSATLSKPLHEFSTPRSTSASDVAQDKLAGTASLFEFASQPRPTNRQARVENAILATSRDAKRSAGSALASSFGSNKLFESEIEATTNKHSENDPESWSDDGVGPLTPAANNRSSKKPAFGSSIMTDSCRSFSDASFAPDDSGVAFSFGDEDKIPSSVTKVQGSLASHLGLRKAATSGGLSNSRKSQSLDALSSPAKAKTIASTPPRRELSFHGATPASRLAIAAVHPFGPREKSSLAIETKWSVSSDNGSAASSPDGKLALQASKSFVSPARPQRDMKGASESNEGTNYFTPQNFKSVKPLQAAFMSTGLVSKRNRAREISEGSTSGSNSDPLPLPPKPNFGHALGLREVVAAANAHAAANPDKLNHAMPDTPVKKSTPAMMPFPLGGGPNSSVRPPMHGHRLAPSPLSIHSPAKDSVSSGASAESPLLPDGCDSPTLNLLSLSSHNVADSVSASQRGWLAFSTLPRSRRSPISLAHTFQPLVAAGESTEDEATLSDTPASPSIQQGQLKPGPTPIGLQKGKIRPSLSSTVVPRKNGQLSHPATGVGITTRSLWSRQQQQQQQQQPPPLPSQEMPSVVSEIKLGHKRAQLSGSEPIARQGPPASRNKNSLSLQRKSSSGANELRQPSTPNSSFAPRMLEGSGPLPMTPTRNTAQIKWFEAAQVVTTPSPSSRRQTTQQLRAHRLELMQNRRKSHLSESMHAQETPVKKEPAFSALMGSNAKFDLADSNAKVGSRLELYFTVEAVIGQGEFSEVVKAVEKTSGCAYAVKRMKKAYTGSKDRLRRLEEVDVLRHLSSCSSTGRSHPNIISLYDAWEEEGHLFVQLELCPLGTLAFFLEEYGQQVGVLDEPRLWKILAELSSGLAHIHSNGLLHLDLKPANIFITEHGTLKIGDFGMATRWPPVDANAILRGAAIESNSCCSYLASSKLMHSTTASPPLQRSWSLEREGDREYLAPEVIFEGKYGKAADIFSLGLILLEAAGNVELPDNGEPWQKLRRDDFSDVDLSLLSGTFLRMLASLLSSRPSERPTTEQIVDHPVMVAVRSRMARGLLTSELDQLPDFNFPASASVSGMTPSTSCSSLSSAVSNRTAGRSDSDGNSAMHEFRSDSGSALGLSGIPASASNHTNSTAISSSSSSSCQLALKIRGALIQEAEDEFMRDVLGSDPAEQNMEHTHAPSCVSLLTSLSPSPIPTAQLQGGLTAIQPFHNDTRQEDRVANQTPEDDAMDLDDD